MTRFKNFKISHMIMISIGIVLVLGATLNIILVLYSMRQQSLREAEAKARILLDRNMAIHTYFSQIMKPKLFEWTAPFRTKEYFEPSWMSSTYAIREIHKYFRSFNPAGYYIKDAAINARSPENEADDFERTFIEKLQKDDKLESFSEVRTIAGKLYLTVLRKGEVVEKSCLLCHSNPGDAPGGLVHIYGPERSFHRKIGETISAVSIRIPLPVAYLESYRITLQLSILLAIVLSLLFGVQFFLYRHFLISPLVVIRDKALAIAGNTGQLGEKIQMPTGREFKDLAAAFNEMSQKLRISMDRLEDRVAERTAELNMSNAELKRQITERRLTEEALRASEWRWRLSIDNMLEAYALHEAIFDENGRMVDYRFLEFNPAAQKISNVIREEIVGRTAMELYPHIVERGLLDRYADVMATGVPAVIDDFYYAGDNLDKALDISCFRIDDRHFVCVFRDITNRKLAEKKIRASLLEKETMLKEIHHRVKNNLQVISSILGLQSGYLQDEKSREIFQESQNRVRVMASVHTQLYQSADLARIAFGGLIKDLVSRLQQSYRIAGSPIEIHTDIAGVSLPIDTSIPCGLIVNELVSNALKHAFPEGSGGEVNVRMSTAGDRFVLKVQDNGIGVPGTVDFQNPQSLGLELVKLLVEQINGAIGLQVEGGTTFTITFPTVGKEE